MELVRPAFHALSAEECASALDSDRTEGLSAAEAARRLAALGPNALPEKGGESVPRQLVGQLTEPLVLVLVGAALVSGVVLGERTDAYVILAIVILNAALGFFQQYRAEQALQRLRQLGAPYASVIRDRRPKRVPAAELVPGDVVSVRAGDRVAADARIVEAHHLATSEAALTGESFAEDKSAQPVAMEAPLADRSSMLYAGTTVVSGRGAALVTATGSATEMGRIASMLTMQRPKTPLERELGHLGRILAGAALAVVALVFLLGWRSGYPAGEMFLTAVALAVAAVPEGLPAVVTITLARGVSRLAARKAIVRRLQAVETLGSASVLCTDKTGTLTRSFISVHELLLDGLAGTLIDLPASDRRVRRYAEIACLCNDAEPDVAGSDPLEAALLDSVRVLGHDVEAMRAAAERVDEVAFDARRKFMTTLHRSATEAGWLLAVKGAPEVVMGRCRFQERASGVSSLRGDEIERLRQTVELRAAQGFRTLAVAYRHLRDRPQHLAAAETDLTLVGVACLTDEMRPEAASSVAEARAAGMRVVMITGDHAETAALVGRRIGIMEPESEVLPGELLGRLTTEQLRDEVRRFSAYARVDPADKVKIVKAWQAVGEVVAMTGDGINDAPALRQADIGVAMGSGNDVSREAAAIVLADDNFATLVSAVREGRGIFDNLKTAVRYLLTTNASEVILMAVGFLAFGQLGPPLLPTQILWVNLVTDGLPVLALAADPPSPDVMRRPPRRRRHIIDLGDGAGILARAIILGAAPLGALVLTHFALRFPWAAVQTTVFTTLVLVQLAYALVVRTEGGRPFGHHPRWLLVSVATSALLQVALVHLAIGGRLFQVVPLSLAGWAIAVGLSVAAAAVARVLPTLENRFLGSREQAGAPIS